VRQVIIRGFLGRKLRSVLTALAIILGVAMIVGSAVLTDQIRGAFDGIFLQARKGTDVVVTKKATFKDDQGTTTIPFNQGLVAKVKAVPGVQQAVARVLARRLLPARRFGSQPGVGLVVLFDQRLHVAARLLKRQATPDTQERAVDSGHHGVIDSDVTGIGSGEQRLHGGGNAPQLGDTHHGGGALDGMREAVAFLQEVLVTG
jgi:hypothetical protein